MKLTFYGRPRSLIINKDDTESLFPIIHGFKCADIKQ